MIPPPSSGTNRSSLATTMADLGSAPVPIPPLPRPRSPPSQDLEDQQEKHKTINYVCCAWMFMTIFTFFILLFVVASLSVAFLHSLLPEISVHSLTFPEFNLQSETGKWTLDSDVDLVIEVFNQNSKISLSFNSMDADVSSNGVALGRHKLQKFHLGVKETKELKIETRVSEVEINENEEKALNTNPKGDGIGVDMVMNGTLDFHNFGNNLLKGLPVNVVCTKVNQTEIAKGVHPNCRVRLFRYGNPLNERE